VEWKDGEKAHELVKEVLKWISKEHMLQW
jgi:hypothetical protein